MSESFDYRRHLLHAVRGFLRGTPTSRARARRIVAACPPTKPFTIRRMVWGSLLSALGDSLSHDDPEYLEELQRFLLGTSRLIRRGYVSYDLRSDMTPQERECYLKLQELIEFLERFPFADVDDAISEYDRRRAELAPMPANLQESAQEADEMIHQLVLREVAAVVLNIDMKLSMLVAKHLAPMPAWVSVHPYHRPPEYPDATNSVRWARKTLLAIAGQDWLYLSWQLTDEGLWFSLH